VVLAQVPVEVNGQWEPFYERSVGLPPTSGWHDVVVRFTHPQQVGGLLDIDTVSFDR
jgi:cytochrome c